MDFNSFIHECRGILLGNLPANAEVVLSAGCSGRWYFDWFENCYGKVPMHIGLELYSPKPESLPTNVRWIANSVSDMRDIADCSVDILFSGQNIEHLFKQDLRGFLLEASRVLKLGGILCLDSPNRLVTVPCKYVQPEHVLELSPQEASLLLDYSGFTVENKYGILDCSSSLTTGVGVDRALTPSTEIGYTDSVDNSFIWWLVARKTREPSPCSLDPYIESLFINEYPLFVGSRFRKTTGILSGTLGTSPVVKSLCSEAGYCLYGPFVPLPSGKYSAYFHIRSSGMQNEDGYCLFDVVSQGGKVVHAAQVVKKNQLVNEWSQVRLDFDLKDYTSGVEARIYVSGLGIEVMFRSDIVPA